MKPLPWKQTEHKCLKNCDVSKCSWMTQGSGVHAQSSRCRYSGWSVSVSSIYLIPQLRYLLVLYQRQERCICGEACNDRLTCQTPRSCT